MGISAHRHSEGPASSAWQVHETRVPLEELLANRCSPACSQGAPFDGNDAAGSTVAMGALASGSERDGCTSPLLEWVVSTAGAALSPTLLFLHAALVIVATPSASARARRR